MLVCMRSKENWLMPTDGQVQQGKTARNLVEENLPACTGLNISSGCLATGAVILAEAEQTAAVKARAV